MATVYYGTSSEAAPILVATGWPKLRMFDINTARANARRASLVEGGVPVLLSLEAAQLNAELSGGLSIALEVHPLQLQVHSVVEDAATAAERLGCETAGVGDFVNGLLKTLDEAHKGIRSAIDVGQGGTAELPSATMLKRTLREIQGKDPDDEDDEDKHRSAKRKADAGLRKFFKKTHKTVMKKIDRMRKKAGVKKPRPQANPRKRAPKSAWAPKGKKPDDAVKWSATRKAKADLVVKGKLNGKPISLRIMAGKSYKVAKTKDGLRVSRPGLRGTFIANPSDAGKL